MNPRISLIHRDFRFYLASRFLTMTAHQMLVVAVGQAVFVMTHSPLHLGYVGLVLFLPKIGLVLLAGQVADRYNRKKVILTCRFIQWVTVIGLIVLAHYGLQPLALLYFLLFIMGCANAFDGPANHAIVSELVPDHHFSNAVTWNSTVMQSALVAGPALGGWLCAFGGDVVFVFYIIAVIRICGIILISVIRSGGMPVPSEAMSWQGLLMGIRYVYKRKIILGTISLDLFAVLLGGAVALLPIYANDILNVGPAGLGFLRAAPSIGGAILAIILAFYPPLKNAGKTMLICVVLFGVATIFFGLSRHFILSMVCLLIAGGADMVSVIVRGVVVQMQTPPEMRGRVSAVNLVFIGASNELGEFESGLTAQWFGVVPSVVIGGVGTLFVVALWTLLFPQIRRYKRLDGSYAQSTSIYL